MSYLLEDIRVIDAASYLAGPGAATVLADYGADVIKIEPPQGDGYRTLVGNYPVGYHWLLTSRNKRSLGLDLSHEEGRAVLHQLVKGADVILTNFVGAQLDRYALGYETLKALNPRLIYAHLTGYGTEGPDKARRAFDVTAWWARSGMMEFIRDPGQTPLSAAPGMGDHATATALFGAIMTGLYRRERTGEGSYVATSLIANGAWANGMALQGIYAGADLGTHRQEKGWVSPFTSIYRTRDGEYLVLAIINPAREWKSLCEALDRMEWVEDPRFELTVIMKHRVELRDLIAARVAELDRTTMVELLDRHDITYSRVMPMAEVAHDEHLIANGIVVPTDDPEEDYQWTIASPITIAEEPKKPPRRAPDVGAHSVEVLRESGFEQAQIDALIASGTVVVAAN
jgi:formyl-CoA transferase